MKPERLFKESKRHNKEKERTLLGRTWKFQQNLSLSLAYAKSMHSFQRKIKRSSTNMTNSQVFEVFSDDLTSVSSGELLGKCEVPCEDVFGINRLRLVLNETALVVYLDKSVVLLTLNDDFETVTITNIIPLVSWTTSAVERHFLPTFVMGDRFYSVFTDLIQWIDLE